MNLRKRAQDHKTKTRHSRAAEGADSIGTTALWEGRGKVAYNGNVKFGDYNDVYTAYNILLYEPNYENTKYLYSGLVTIPDPDKRKDGKRDKTNRKREQPVGRVRMYPSHGDSVYLVIWIGDVTEDGNFDYPNAEVYTSPLVESDSDNVKSPVLFGDLYEGENQSVAAKDKQRVKQNSQLLRKNKTTNKDDDWYTDLGPDDLMAIIKQYDDDIFAYFMSNLKSYLIKEGKQPQLIVEGEVDELSDDDDDEDMIRCIEEYDDDDDEYEDEEALPKVSLSIPGNKPRIYDTVKTNETNERTARRVGSDLLEGLQDVNDPADLL